MRAILTLLLIALPWVCRAADIPVSNTNDSGSGSLRQALLSANPGDTVDLSGLADNSTITLQSRLYISQSVNIQGPTTGTVTISGNNATRLFFIQSGIVNIANLTLANGYGKGGDSYYGGGAPGMGGGIFQNGGIVTLTSVIMSNNNAAGGRGGGNFGMAAYGGGGFGGNAPTDNSDNGAGGGDLGGAGGAANTSGEGGAGGDGGGGGLGGTTGGRGGFGGGGGGSITVTGGAGGFGGGGGAGASSGTGGWGGGGGGSNIGTPGGGAGLGGAIFERSGTLTLNSVIFTNNSALEGVSSTNSLNGQAKGGALFVYFGAIANLIDVTFSGSVAADAGAAGIGNSAAPYNNGDTCPGQDTVDICGLAGAIGSSDATQTTPPGNAFTPLAITVSAGGAAVPDGTLVTFVAPLTGASGVFSNGLNIIVVQTVSGVASAPFTANGISGTYTVTATVGLLTQAFTLTNQCSASVPVTNTNDSGTGSLRASIAGTCVAGTVDLSGFGNATKFSLQSRLYVFQDVTIQGPAAATVTIDGGGATRLFFVQSGNVAIKNLTLANGLGQGGSSYNGGGAAGMGGAIFQNGGNVTLTNVVLSGNAAVGGDSSVASLIAGGGGGFGGNTTALTGGSGGDLGGSGGTDAVSGTGGAGGAGGGGGSSLLGTGGAGGFGGGGGKGASTGGAGGFGGGGGDGTGGTGGFGGGNGLGTGHGGGGAGFGGAIFELTGTLTLNTVTFSGNTATAGTGSNNGQAKGGALFIYSGATATLNGVTFSSSVAADAGKPGIGSSASPYVNGAKCPGEDTVDICGGTFSSVTVSTNVAGLSFTVDQSAASTTPQTLSWANGSSHTLTTTTPQAGTTGTQYVFTGWSDGTTTTTDSVTASRSVTSYTANFKTQYLLTTAANPPADGTVSAGGYFDANSVQSITATANANYKFSSWTGAVASASSASTTVTMSGPESVTANFAGSAGFVTGDTPGPLRNNYAGFVGMEMTVGPTPTTAYSLGRFVIAGNTQTHIVKLVQANGTDVAGGSVTITTSGATPGAFAYAALTSPVTLLANTSYFLVSQETLGGDQWYDYGPVTLASVGSVVGPAYTDANGKYVAVTVLPGQSYVPVSFLYAPPTTALSVSITSPTANAVISGTASIAVTTTGPVTSLQVQVDGVNQGSPVSVSVNQGPAYTLSLDTTVLKVGSHSLTVVANGTAASAPVNVSISNTPGNLPGGSAGFVVSETPGPLRNNYSGFVGMSFSVGSTPVVVTSLGRYAVSGNSGTHLLKLVNADGTDVPGGSVSVSMSGATAGTFQYGALPAGPFTLLANTTYYLVSQETSGGDQWYNYGPVSTSVVATVIGPAYTDGAGHYVTVGDLVGQSYVPVSFLYGPTANTLSATVTSPQSGALLSGSVPVSVVITGTATSYQLQVDGTNVGAAAASSPITLNTTLVSNGQHTLSVVISGGGATAVSPSVTVTVNNQGDSITAFTTSQTPSTLRNNYGGFVGMSIQVGASPVSVVSLGRFVVAGNSGTHTLKLVQANGTDVAGGSVSLSLAGATAGQYAYAALASPVTLSANTLYYLASQETSGGDQWYDLEPITTTGVAQVTGPTYADGNGNYVTVGGFTGYSYVPLSFKYQ